MSNVSLPPEPHLTQASNIHNDVLTHTGDMPKTARIATHTEPTPRTIRTTCPYCGVGCGVLASIDDAGSISVTVIPSIQQTSVSCVQKAAHWRKHWVLSAV